MKKISLKKPVSPRHWRLSRCERDQLAATGTQIHVTDHDKKHKLAGLQSISTSVLVNPICEQRRLDKDSPCFNCYACNQCRRFKQLELCEERNTAILCSRLLTGAEATAVPVCSALARVESFGDVMNVTQARNYYRIIKTHRFSHWGVWTKNPGIWSAALKLEGVRNKAQMPENMEFVLSSMKLDQRATMPASFRPYCNKIMTVWTSKEVYEAVPLLNDDYTFSTKCAGIRCMSCGLCYMPSDFRKIIYIDELLRK